MNNLGLTKIPFFFPPLIHAFTRKLSLSSPIMWLGGVETSPLLMA